MFPDSYGGWHADPLSTTVTDPKTGLEVHTMALKNDIINALKCPHGCLSSFIKNGVCSRTILDYDPNMKQCVSVKLRGPVFQCENCKSTIDATTLGHSIPPKTKISPDILPYILDEMYTTGGKITQISKRLNVARTTVETMVRETINSMTNKIATYMPCRVLLFLPIPYANRKAMLIGGIARNGDNLIYDILPTYSQIGIKNAIKRLENNLAAIEMVIVEPDERIIELCQDYFPKTTVCVSYRAVMNTITSSRFDKARPERDLVVSLVREKCPRLCAP